MGISLLILAMSVRFGRIKRKAKKKRSPTGSFLPINCNIRHFYPTTGHMGFIRMNKKRQIHRDNQMVNDQTLRF